MKMWINLSKKVMGAMHYLSYHLELMNIDLNTNLMTNLIYEDKPFWFLNYEAPRQASDYFIIEQLICDSIKIMQIVNID
jgi:hypothetical protein